MIEEAGKIETEVKFSVPNKATFDSLKNLTLLGNFELQQTGTKVIFDQYLDTADYRFMQAGYAFRIRTAKQKTVATLKSLTPPEGDVHRRQEIEQTVDTPHPTDWSSGEAKTLVLNIANGVEIKPLFALHQTRHKYRTFLAQQPVIEFSLDEVSQSEAGTVDYFELEAELIEDGTETILTQFVNTLQTQWPLQAERKSKFERGFAAKDKS